jgi:hypothetical protein
MRRGGGGGRGFAVAPLSLERGVRRRALDLLLINITKWIKSIRSKGKHVRKKFGVDSTGMSSPLDVSVEHMQRCDRCKHKCQIYTGKLPTPQHCVRIACNIMELKSLFMCSSLWRSGGWRSRVTPTTNFDTLLVTFYYNFNHSSYSKLLKYTKR